MAGYSEVEPRSHVSVSISRSKNIKKKERAQTAQPSIPILRGTTSSGGVFCSYSIHLACSMPFA